jgi:hypothetical protein
MRFESRGADWPLELLRDTREAVGMGYGVDVARAREVHAAHRRLTFFERSDDGWEAMLPYRRLLDFEAALEPDGEPIRNALATEILRAISIARGVTDARRLEGHLWLATASVESGFFPSYRRFPRDDFELAAVAPVIPYMEIQPEFLELIYRPTDTRLRLDLDLLEVLERIQAGYVPSSEEARGLLVNLSLFENRLLATPTDELVVFAEAGDVKIGRGNAPGSVALVEEGA